MTHSDRQKPHTLIQKHTDLYIDKDTHGHRRKQRDTHKNTHRTHNTYTYNGKDRKITRKTDRETERTKKYGQG